jgi:hypothetical protein
MKTVDMHAHVAVPADLVDIVKGTPLENTVRGQLNATSCSATPGSEPWTSKVSTSKC